MLFILHKVVSQVNWDDTPTFAWRKKDTFFLWVFYSVSAIHIVPNVIAKCHSRNFSSWIVTHALKVFGILCEFKYLRYKYVKKPLKLLSSSKNLLHNVWENIEHWNWENQQQQLRQQVCWKGFFVGPICDSLYRCKWVCYSICQNTNNSLCLRTII